MTDLIEDTVCKGKLEICPIDSFAKLDSLINVDKIKKEVAFKKVAEEWNNTHPDAVVKWESLKKAYNRSSKPTLEFRDNVPKNTKIKSGTMSRKLEEENEQLKIKITELEERIKNLEYSNELLNAELLKSMGIEAPPQKSVVEEVILLTRPEVDAAIAHYGNDIQKGVLKDNKKNSEVFRVFCGVRSRYLENNPPISLPIRLREAIGCVDDSENNTEHIPKKILRA